MRFKSMADNQMREVMDNAQDEQELDREANGDN